MVITRGAKGAISIDNDIVTEIGINNSLNVIDLTGAGDLFAAGYLHGFINKFSQQDCLKNGTELASKVIQQIGARL